jgi:hypothetical protein
MNHTTTVSESEGHTVSKYYDPPYTVALGWDGQEQKIAWKIVFPLDCKATAIYMDR